MANAPAQSPTNRRQFLGRTAAAGAGVLVGGSALGLAPSFAAALESARVNPERILITGSLHFAGEVVAHLRGEPAAFEECAQ